MVSTGTKSKRLLSGSNPMNKAQVVSLFQEALCSADYASADVRRDYEFSDPVANDDPLRRIPLAAFGGYPRNYTNARIGIVIANENGEGPALRHRALGAPLIVTVTDKRAQPWAVGMDNVTIAGDAFHVADAVQVFRTNRHVWGPEALGRVRSARAFATAIQTDIFDTGITHALSRQFQVRLKEQLELSFQETAAAYRAEHRRQPRGCPA